MNRTVKLVGKIAATLLLVAVLGLVAAVTLIPQARGGAGLIVETASMVPTINPGDVVASRPVTIDELNIGDIITFATEDSLITHRVIGFGTSGDGERTVITQGDANEVPDTPLKAGQIRGRVDYVVPRVGRLIPWLLEHVLWLIAAAGAFFVVSWAIEKWRERNGKDVGASEAESAVKSMAKRVDDAQPVEPQQPTNSRESAIYTTAPALSASPQFNAQSAMAPLAEPNVTVVSTPRTTATFTEPITVSSVHSGGGQPVTMVSTPSSTTVFQEPITVSAGRPRHAVTRASESHPARQPDVELWAEVDRWLELMQPTSTP